MRCLVALTLTALLVVPPHASAQGEELPCPAQRKAYAAAVANAQKVSTAAGATKLASLARMEMKVCSDPARAVREYDKAIALDPTYVTARAGRCNALLKASRAEDAVQECIRALKLNPTNVEALEARGDAYRKLGKLTEALDDFKQLAEMRPDLDRPVIKRAKIYFDLNRLVDAAKEIKRSAELTGSLTSFELSDYGGDYAEKQSVTQPLFDKHRTDPNVAQHLPPAEVAAFLNGRARDEKAVDKALALANEALSWLSRAPKGEADPYGAPPLTHAILNHRAALLLQSGDIVGAERDFEDAARTDQPSSAVTRWNAAKTVAQKLSSTSSAQAAARLLQTAMALDDKTRGELGFSSVASGAFLVYAEIAKVHGRAALAAKAPEGVTECDRVAGHLHDARRVVEGIQLESVEAAKAIAACSDALKASNIPRLKMQRGIGYLRQAQAQADQAQRARPAQLMMQDLTSAISAQYPAANMLLGHAVDKDLAQPPRGGDKYVYIYDLNILALNQVLKCCGIALIGAMQEEARLSSNTMMETAALALLDWAARLGSSEAQMALAARELQRAGEEPLDEAATGRLLSHVAIARKIKQDAEMPPQLAKRFESISAEAPKGATSAAAAAPAAWSPTPSNKAPPWFNIPEDKR